MPDPVVHFEIISPDAATLHRFYGSVFGWKIAVDNPFGYGMVDTRTPGRGINGGIGAPHPGGRGHFTIYVQVPNIDAALSRVITEGGRIAMPKSTVPNGPTLAQFFDPAGHLMGLIEGANPPDSAPRTRVAAAPSPRRPLRAQPKSPGKVKPKPKPAAKKKRRAKVNVKKSAAKRNKGKSRR